MAKTAKDYLAEQQAAAEAQRRKALGLPDASADQALEGSIASRGAANQRTRELANLTPVSQFGDNLGARRGLQQQFMNTNNDLANERLRLAMARGEVPMPGAMSDAEMQANANKSEAYDIARGGVSRVTDDPVDALIRQQLQGVATGKNVPFNDEVRNSMFSEQADMGAAANANRAEKILAQASERGLSMNDPSVQAALRKSQTEQQLGAQGARQDIAKTANRENFAAQQSGLRDLSGVNSAYQGRITGAERNLQGMLWNEQFNQKTPMPGQQPQMPKLNLPNYTQYSSKLR